MQRGDLSGEIKGQAWNGSEEQGWLHTWIQQTGFGIVAWIPNTAIR